MSQYTAITFAPVQGFIEKSRKLRDLYGASSILSYVSYKIIKSAENSGFQIISPGLPNIQKGMPNRILLKGDKEFSRNEVTNAIRQSWRQLLDECRNWIEKEVPPKDKYLWQQEWMRWGLYTWEIFWGHGDCSESAMNDLENRKLRRDWTAINWQGDSSSLTGTDAIAWPRLGFEDLNPGRQLFSDEKKELKDFYQRLSCALENLPPDGQPEGKFLAPNEKLSIPELVKRLVTREDIAKRIDEKMEYLEKGFNDLIRMPENGVGQWTGWFMGDGDEVGKKLKKLAEKEGDEGLIKFSKAMRTWSEKFINNFPKDKGRVVYAGGDDFLGIIYSSKPEKPPEPIEALEWLMRLPEEWKKHGQDISLSVGFVWAGHSVPQRDVLQHCREAEKRAKSLGRDRVTIRVVFNSGQFVQWTCPWDYLDILTKYRDRDGKTYPKLECQGQKSLPDWKKIYSQDSKYLPNWTHVYSDLAQLKARHAISFNPKEDNPDDRLALALFQLYFQERDNLEKNWKNIVGDYPNSEQSKQFIYWISDLVNVGWQLCSNISSL